MPNHSFAICEYFDEVVGAFQAKYNPWDQDQFNVLTIKLKPNDVLRIPRFWWYSLKGCDKQNALVINKVETIVSTVLSMPYMNEYFRDIITT
tara:strand:+ start:1108 stop:1383 length:276 start_codon:yes stop_codon:yes gene_type:complete